MRDWRGASVSTNRRMKRLPAIATALSTLACLALTSCVGTPINGEREARERVAQTGRELHSAPLPLLPGADEADNPAAYLRYALWHHPAVEAAFQDWLAATADVVGARSLPDPRLTLQLDYAGGLTSLMPGAMADYLTRGKRVASGNAALAAGDVAYRAYCAQIFETSANLRRAWLELAYADEALKLRTTVVAAYEAAAAASGNDYATATGGDLSTIVTLKNEAARQKALLAALEDRRTAARAAFKAALVLARNDTDPTWPTTALKAGEEPSEDELWTHIEASNPDLLNLRAMVAQAVAGIDIAQTARTPDFSFGGMADVKASPLMLRPQAALTLPIWKDKIQAGIDAATARRDAATARVSARELDLAAQLAQALYQVRSADRVIAFIDASALPALRSAAAISTSNFQSGRGMATAPAEARAQIAMAELDRLDALLERENAATDLLLISANIAPGAALLVGR